MTVILVFLVLPPPGFAGPPGVCILSGNIHLYVNNAHRTHVNTHAQIPMWVCLRLKPTQQGYPHKRHAHTKVHSGLQTEKEPQKRGCVLVSVSIDPKKKTNTQSYSQGQNYSFTRKDMGHLQLVPWLLSEKLELVLRVHRTPDPSPPLRKSPERHTPSGLSLALHQNLTLILGVCFCLGYPWFRVGLKGEQKGNHHLYIDKNSWVHASDSEINLVVRETVPARNPHVPLRSPATKQKKATPMHPLALAFKDKASQRKDQPPGAGLPVHTLGVLSHDQECAYVNNQVKTMQAKGRSLQEGLQQTAPDSKWASLTVGSAGKFHGLKAWSACSR